MRVGAALAATLFLLVSGCVGTSGSSSQVPPPATAEKTDDTGGIEGTVVDDELVPISKAQVGLAQRNASTQTGEDGGFAFSRIEPGAYTIVAARLGYFEAYKQVTVIAGEITKVQLTLDRIPISEPAFNETWKIRDQLPISTGCADRGNEATKGHSWDEYPIPINATKPDGTELAAIYTDLDLKHGTGDAAVDIDMYFYDPTGKQVGSSAGGTADEHISVDKLLKPGIYKLQVCFWLGAVADYQITVTITYEQGEAASFAKKPKK